MYCISVSVGVCVTVYRLYMVWWAKYKLKVTAVLQLRWQLHVKRIKNTDTAHGVPRLKRCCGALQCYSHTLIPHLMLLLRVQTIFVELRPPKAQTEQPHVVVFATQNRYAVPSARLSRIWMHN
jgi:hypothetical protein